MFAFFESLQNVIKLNKTCIDNEVFRLHYKVTMIILVAASLLVTGKEYFGDPIDCIQVSEEVRIEFLDTYCWIHSTFTLPSAQGKTIGIEVPHPGVDKWTPNEERVYHKYYQWVCFALFFQGLAFYFPRYLWKLWEGGRVKNIIQNLTNPVLTENEKRNQISLLNKYLLLCLKSNNVYFVEFIICECLNLINLVLQIYFMDQFLGGEFSTYGWDVLKHTEQSHETRTDPMIRVFPRMTKCTFHFFGSSGDLQRHDSLCILPLNIINEKIYIFLWFWFLFLLIVTCISLTLRVLTVLLPRVRYLLLKARSRFADRYVLNYLVNEISPSDWFLIHLLSKNLDPVHFKDLLAELARSLRNSASDNNGKPLIVDKSSPSEML